MRARRIIEGAAFGPDAILTAVQAFEAAWSEIAGRFDAAEHEAARESLATAIINSAREDSTDANLLKGAGLRAIARAYPDQFAALLPPSYKAEGKGN